MDKRDLKLELRHLYRASVASVAEVDVPTMNFLMVDGEGDPNTSPAFSAAIEALFKVSYAAKFIVKKGPDAIDYVVMPLEGLWWADDMAAFRGADKSNWKWTAMVMQPAFVSREVIDRAMAQVNGAKHPETRLRFEAFTEGRCAQTLHVGPFSEEGPAIARVHAFIAARGSRAGKHHEIYLSDMRRAAPAAWKTIVRQPMR